MARCNELCTKEATGHCAVCEAMAESDRFIRFWFKGGLFLDCHDRFIARLQDQSKAPRCWWDPIPRSEIRHKDVVREAHKQYSETLNKTMLSLLGVALFCLLITFGSPDKLLLAADSMVGAFGDSYASRRRRRYRSNTRSNVPLYLAQRSANISLLLASYHQAPERLRRT